MPPKKRKRSDDKADRTNAEKSKKPPKRKTKRSDADEDKENQPDDRLDRIMSSEGRLKEETKKRRSSILESFKTKVHEAGGNFEDLIKPNEDAKKALERAMVKFFDDYEVLDKDTGAMTRPKANSLNYLLSQLKCILSDKTGYNFSDKVAFRGLANATATLQKEIKRDGRYDIFGSYPTYSNHIRRLLGYFFTTFIFRRYYIFQGRNEFLSRNSR